MKNSTFSAQVANNLLTLLQGYSKTIRLLLVMFLTLTVSVSAWGATETLSCSKGTISNNTMTFSTTNFTFVHAKGSGSSFAAYTPWRVYANNTVTVTAGSGVASIDKIEIVHSSTYYSTIKSSSGSVKMASTSGGTTTINSTSGKTVTLTVTGTSQSRWSSIKITYTAAASCNPITPSLSYTPSSLSVGGTANPTLTGNSGNGSVTYSSSNTSVATVNASTGIVTAKAAGTTTITATIAANKGYCEGTATANVTVTADPYTVKFYKTSTTFESVTETSAGAGVTPPTMEEECGEWEFQGWSESSSNSETSTTPLSLVTLTNGKYYPTEDIDLYPVYTKSEGGGGTVSWNKITTAPADWSGEYLIVNSDYAMTSDFYSGTSGEFKGASVTVSNNQVTSSPSDKMIWIVEKNGSSAQYSFKNKSTGTYAKITGTSSTNAALSSSVIWFTISSSSTSGVWKINSVDNSARCFAYYSTNKTFRTYANSSNTTGSLYKKEGSGSTTYYYSYPDCGTPTPTPTLNVDPATLTFENTTTNTSTQKTFTLTGYNLTANASLQLSGINPGMFSLSSNSVTQSAGSINQTITVTYTPTATGSHNATLTISSTGAESKTVTLSGTGVAPAAKYTVTFNAGSGTCGTESLAEESAGAGVTLPTANPPATCATDGWKFAGWWTGSVAETTTSPGELLTAGLNYKPTSDCTLYAVYSYTEAGGGDSNVTFNFSDIATANSWTNGTAYTTVTISPITINAKGGGNNGKYYSSNKSWRMYNGGSLQISSNTGKITSVSSNPSKTFTINDEGTATLSFSATTEFTSITVSYSSTTTTYNSNPSCEVCENILSINKGEETNGNTFTLSQSGNVETCDGVVEVVVTPTPAEHYSVSEVTATTPTTGGAPTVTNNGNDTWTVTYAQNSTGTSTINVTFVEDAKASITLSELGVENTVNTTYYVGAQYTLPSISLQSCAGKQLVGWSTVEVDETDTKPTDNYYELGAKVTLKATQTFYAVYATLTAGGEGTVTKINADDAFYYGDKIIIIAENTNYGLYRSDSSNYVNYWTTSNNDGVPTVAEIEADSKRFIEISEVTTDGTIKLGNVTDGYLYNPSSTNLSISTTDASDWELIAWNDNTFTFKAVQYLSCRTDMNGTNANKWRGAGSRCNCETGENCSGIIYYNIYRYTSGTSYTAYSTSCNTHTVTFYGFNSGGYTTTCNDNPAEIAVAQGGTYVIPNCEPTFDPAGLGRTFAGTWNTQADGQGTTYEPGDEIVNVSNDITLYAQWALNTSENTTLPTNIDDLATTDIVVNSGTTLTLKTGTTTINSLTLKGGLLGKDSKSGYDMPSVVIPEGATLVRNNTTINLDLVVNSDSWYPFAVPFAVANNSNIDYLDPVLQTASIYGTHFAIKTYDGENRAKVGTDQANNWDIVPESAGLQPGKGYIISARTYRDKDTATIRIPMSVPNEWLADGEQESITVKEQTTTRNKVTVYAHEGAAATEHQRHAGWNFVANPYLSKFAGSNVANDVTYIKGSINIQDKYTYEDTEVTYVTVPAYNFAYYEQFKLSTTKLSPAYSFFVQVGESGTMTFETAGRQQAPASIAARNAEERPVKMDVDITLSDNHSSDQTGIIISDRYSDAYEIGRDLEKLFGSAYNLSVYTLMADNTPLAFQALAIRSNMQVIPVGYRAPEQGEYTFRLNEATSSIDLLNEQYEQLVLVDYQTGELTNLLISDYTFYSERTQADNRFAIYAVPRQNAPTDLPNAIGQDKQAQKIIHNGHLYILRDGNVYNGNGQIVK